MSEVLSAASSLARSLKGIRLCPSELIPLKPVPAWRASGAARTNFALLNEPAAGSGRGGGRRDVKVVGLAGDGSMRLWRAFSLLGTPLPHLCPGAARDVWRWVLGRELLSLKYILGLEKLVE